MEKNPKVSVIIAVYNVEPYLRKCLDSVLQQTWQNFELLLVDDGSTDGSPSIMEEYRGKDPDRIFTVHKENGGQASARNLAMQKMTGDYLVFLDSDDYLAGDYLERLVREAVIYDLDMVCSGQHKVTEAGEIVDTISYQVSNGYSLQRRLNIAGKLYRTDYVRKWKISFPEGKLYEDNSFNMLAFFLSDRIRFLAYEGYYQVVHEGSTTAKLIDYRVLPFDNWRYCIETVKGAAVRGVDQELYDFTMLSFFTYFLFVRNRMREYLTNENRKNSMENAYRISDEFESMANDYFRGFSKNRYLRLLKNRELILTQKAGVRMFYLFSIRRKLRLLVKAVYRL